MDVVLGYGPGVDVENMLERAKGLLVRHSARAKGVVVVLGPLHSLVALDLDLVPGMITVRVRVRGRDRVGLVALYLELVPGEGR